MKIENPEDPEQYWMVSRVKVVEEHYFDNEDEARAFARNNLSFIVDPPEKSNDPKT